MLSLNLTPKRFLNLGFVCSLLTFTKQKTNDCSPWATYFYVMTLVTGY